MFRAMNMIKLSTHYVKKNEFAIWGAIREKKAGFFSPLMSKYISGALMC